MKQQKKKQSLLHHLLQEIQHLCSCPFSVGEGTFFLHRKHPRKYICGRILRKQCLPRIQLFRLSLILNLTLKGLGLPCRGKRPKKERLEGVNSFLRGRGHLLHLNPQKHKGCPLILGEIIVPRPTGTLRIINFYRDFIPWQE